MKYKIKFIIVLLLICELFIGANGCNAYAFDGEILAPHALKKGDKICILEPARISSPEDVKIVEERLPFIIENLKKGD